MQLENYYLEDIYPLHAGLTWLPEGDLYAALSGAGTGIGSKVWQFNGRYPGKNHNFELHRRTLKVIVRLRDIKISGDYYPLSEKAEELENWCAYQVHVPGLHSGCVVYFRRTESPAVEQNFHLQGIDPEQTYSLEFFDGHMEIVQGRELLDISLKLDVPRSVGVIFYRTKE